MKDATRQPKPTLLHQMGGVSGLIYASLPSVVFIVADAAAGLNAAVALAVGAGAGITGLRLMRREPLQPAFSGLLGVGIAAFIAYQTETRKTTSWSASGRVSFWRWCFSRRSCCAGRWSVSSGAPLA